MNLVKQVKALQSQSIRKTIDKRLSEFQSFESKDHSDWFSELCFCILTGNAKAKTALAIQAELGGDGFLTTKPRELTKVIRTNKHRFHNTKSQRIVEARKHNYVKSIMHVLPDDLSRRNWLVKNVKGLGLKEASHFLRNTGHNNVAIIDRHIIRILDEHNLVKTTTKTMTPKSYLAYERACQKLAKKLNLNLAELDLYLWYIKTGEVLK